MSNLKTLTEEQEAATIEAFIEKHGIVIALEVAQLSTRIPHKTTAAQLMQLLLDTPEMDPHDYIVGVNFASDVAEKGRAFRKHLLSKGLNITRSMSHIGGGLGIALAQVFDDILITDIDVAEQVVELTTMDFGVKFSQGLRFQEAPPVKAPTHDDNGVVQ